jgi:hypothetical protein
MKSFRLDRESVNDFVESWPIIFVALAVTGLFGYLGWLDAFWRVCLVLIAGAYFGYVLRGMLTQNLMARYPNARWIGLLSVGLVVAALGVFVRMAFPATQGDAVDIAWLSLSFVCILTFIVINRRDPDVLR